jgi:hypothetical protein
MRQEIGPTFSGIFAGVSIAAAQDFFVLTAALTGKGVIVHRVEIATDDDEVSQMLVAALKIGKGHTAGAGGSTATPARIKAGLGAATAAVRINTAVATAGAGSLTVVGRRPFNVVTGLLYAPTEIERVTIAPGEAFIVNLVNAPGAGINMSGEVIFEEVQ